MPIDFEKVNDLLQAAKSLIRRSKMEKSLTEEKIEEAINRTATFEGELLLPEEFEYIKRELQYQYQVKCSPGQSILNDYDQENWYDECKSAIEPKFWSRYRNYLIDVKNFSPNVVTTLGDETLDEKLMNSIGNPKSDKSFLKRGLIIGDVQSGKTSTYIGLMCKAADAGYKVFILLTGTIESLRRQTQERVEDGFIGIDMSSKGDVRVGVGLDGKPLFAKALTSRQRDFVDGVTTIADSLANNNQAVVFVIKKNPTTLRNLTKWLIRLNVDPITKKINEPMLMIDDEADNASINTSKNKEDPTTINKLIRELANVFTKSNYVGFTATPFANVFIDPETTEKMETQDLFPEDFIVALPTPNNYVGPTKIYPKGAPFHNQLIYINDAGCEEADKKSFYFKHKRNWRGALPESLTDSIYAFYIANTLRDLRGDWNEHRSMLVNISRFVDVQKYTKEQIEAIHANAYRAIKFNSGNLKDPVIKRIHNIFKTVYKSVEFSWKDVSKKMYESIENIKIKVVNSTKNSEKLIYPKNESLRVIAIGGLALSRGLTLEGLIISYFYRNTSTYDVLMQMGRWFGYRRNYEDLFRIWTAKNSAEWYAEIAEATDQLKIDMDVMRDKHLKPKDFGIRVRNNSNELQITSNNKMRNATNVFQSNGYFGGSAETPYLETDKEKLVGNYKAVVDLILNCKKDGMQLKRIESQNYKSRYMLQNVPKKRIIEIMNRVSISRYCLEFDPKQIAAFISSCGDRSIDFFDIAFMEGGNTSREVTIDNMTIHRVERDGCHFDTERGKINIGSRGKLSGPDDGMVGIFDHNGKKAKEIIENAKKMFSDEHGQNKKMPTDAWFEYVKDRNPLLMIYLMDLNMDELQEKNSNFSSLKDEMGTTPFTAFMIGFPRNEAWSSISFTKYKANKSYNYYDRDHSEEEMQEVG